MKKQVILLLVLFISSFTLFATDDNKLVLSGKVNDQHTRESLTGVKVSIEGTSISTYTDLNGNYVLFVPRSLMGKIVFSSISYAENKIDIKTALTSKEINLIPTE